MADKETPKPWDAVAYLREAVTQGRITKTELGAHAGVHTNSLIGLEGDSFNPRWSTLAKLCTAADEIKAARA